MLRHMGEEAAFGAGGGRISREAIRNLDIAEDLCRRDRPKDAVPYLTKAMNDPRNLDAWVKAAFLAPNLVDSTDCLKFAEKQGRKLLERDLGSKCFTETPTDGGHVGEFWDILDTRPYMRVLQALVTIYENRKLYGEAADVVIEMLRLCPGDNLSQRTLLPTQLATSGRYEQTLRYAQAWIEDDASHPDGKASPSQEPLTAERIEAFTARKWTKAEYFYSSALAAFRLWGDCELARQYLYIGARLNPQILIRIMAKVKKPQHINIRPRAPNSPEDAQDYLFTAQDTWMEPDVWMWASGQQDVQPCIMKQCTRDGCSNHEETVAQFKRCASCHLVFYCSRDCQKADWKFHKPECKKYLEMKNFRKAVMIPSSKS